MLPPLLWRTDNIFGTAEKRAFWEIFASSVRIFRAPPSFDISKVVGNNFGSRTNPRSIPICEGRVNERVVC